MSAISRYASRCIAVLKLPEYQVPQLVTQAGFIVRSMTGNPSFPSPHPPLSTIQAAIDALDDAESTARAGKHGTAALRDDKRTALVMLLEQLCCHVQTIADADRDHAASIIEGSGMFVKKVPTRKARVFGAMRGPVEGSVALVAPQAANRAGYEWAYSIDGMKTWVSLPFTVKATTTVHGLVPGTMAHFRYRVVTKDGTGDWSDPVTMMVE